MARIVRVASCTVEWLRSEDEATDVLRARALDLVATAGEQGADIVCLPEFCASDVKQGRHLPQAIPGPITDTFAALASKYRMYVIVPIIEDVGKPKAFNTSVLIDRQGNICGCYRKTHICLPDYGEGELIMAGDEVPVFKADFGTIGITICMDLHYPELYAHLAHQGAEIIFWPTAAMDYTGDLIESLVNARAVDNQVYMVPSSYVRLPYLVGQLYGRSRIVDCMGRIRADTGHFPGVAMAAIDLDETYPMWYRGPTGEAYPTMRDVLQETKRSGLYSGKSAAPIARQKQSQPTVQLSVNEWRLVDLAEHLAMPRSTLYRWVRLGWVRARKQAIPGHAGAQWILWADAKETQRLSQLRHHRGAGRP